MVMETILHKEDIWNKKKLLFFLLKFLQLLLPSTPLMFLLKFLLKTKNQRKLEMKKKQTGEEFTGPTESGAITDPKP